MWRFGSMSDKLDVLIIYFAIYITMGVLTFLTIDHYVIEQEYRKFTALPSIPLYRSLKKDKNYSTAAIWATTIVYQVIIYLPMTIIWIAVWLLWKFYCTIAKLCKKLVSKHNSRRFQYDNAVLPYEDVNEENKNNRVDE